MTNYGKEAMDAVYERVAEEVMGKAGISNHESGGMRHEANAAGNTNIVEAAIEHTAEEVIEKAKME